LHQGRVVAEGTPAELRRTLPGRRVTARTSVPAEVLRAVDGVVSVAARDEDVDITTTEAEPVVRTMLELDLAVSDLVVATASLDEVLIALTETKEDLVAREPEPCGWKSRTSCSGSSGNPRRSSSPC